MEQKNAPKPIPVYKKYPLSRIVSVREIVSADYVMGSYKRRFPHAHQEAWEMCFCMEGEVAYYQDGREVRVRPGQVIFTSPGIIHDAYIDDPAAVSFFISFTCSDTYIQMLRQRKVRITRQQERLMERLVLRLLTPPARFTPPAMPVTTAAITDSGLSAIQAIAPSRAPVMAMVSPTSASLAAQGMASRTATRAVTMMMGMIF